MGDEDLFDTCHRCDGMPESVDIDSLECCDGRVSTLGVSVVDLSADDKDVQVNSWTNLTVKFCPFCGVNLHVEYKQKEAKALLAKAETVRSE